MTTNKVETTVKYDQEKRKAEDKSSREYWAKQSKDALIAEVLDMRKKEIMLLKSITSLGVEMTQLVIERRQWKTLVKGYEQLVNTVTGEV